MLNEISDLRNRGIDIAEIAFCSFTRAATRTAIERACDAFDVTPQWMGMNSWFRTIHAIAFRKLDEFEAKVVKLLTWNAEDRDEWFRQNVEDCKCGMKPISSSEDYLADGLQSDSVDNYWGPVLRMWDACRLRLKSPSVKLARQMGFGVVKGHSVDYSDYTDQHIIDMIAKFERAKRITSRLDFSDYIARMAGVDFSPDGNHNLFTQPTIDLPDCLAWFFDEYQDMNPLLDKIVDRVIEDSPAKVVYVAGDPFQSIYGFSGSEPRLFIDRFADETIELHKSWRCPESILRLGERVIRRHPDYVDRGVTSDNHGDGKETLETGKVADVIKCLRSMDLRSGKGGKPVAFFLARTNQDVTDVKKALNESGIPWASTKDTSQAYVHSASIEISQILIDLRNGNEIMSSEWRKLVAKIPHKLDGEEMLRRGVKSSIKLGNLVLPGDLSGNDMPCIQLQDTLRYGATEDFIRVVQSSRWFDLFPKAKMYVDAVDQFGEDAAAMPGLRVGTIHSVKGEEADVVILLDRVSDFCFSESGLPAEACVSYVGVTRAKKKLIILRQTIKSKSIVMYGKDDWQVKLPSLGVPEVMKLATAG